jgi:hypothetical protein
MDSIKLNLKFWLAGLIAGVILVERWHATAPATS